MSDHTLYNFPHGNGDPRHVFSPWNDSKIFHTYQSVSVAVSEKLPCQREGANSSHNSSQTVDSGSYRHAWSDDNALVKPC